VHLDRWHLRLWHMAGLRFHYVEDFTDHGCWSDILVALDGSARFYDQF
jgi:hypothetical protein